MDTNLPLVVTQPADFIYQFAASTVYAGDACDMLFAARASGLYWSRDNGKTWELAYKSMHTSEMLPTIAVALSPDFEHLPHVIAGLNGAILRSPDEGKHWQVCHVPTPPPVVTCMIISPEYPQDGRVFAGTNEDGVLVSNNCGENWISWNFGLLDLNTLCLVISPDFANDETLYVGTNSGVFRSTNGGRAWKEMSLPIGFDAVLSLAISPDFSRDNTVFVGTENNGLLISEDRGKSWQSFTKTLEEAPINSVLLSPEFSHDRKILLLHGGKLLLSEDHGKTWKSWHKKLFARKNVTTVFALGSRKKGILIGFEDGSINWAK